jgi:hypothetical protein
MNLPAIFERAQGEPPLVLRTPLSINDITANLHRLARAWHESGMPNDLWEIGLIELVVEQIGDQLTLEWSGKTNPVNNPALFLTIVRLSNGGSEVTARFGRGKLEVFALLLLLITPLQLIGRERGPIRWFFVAGSLAISLALLFTGKSNTALLKSHLLKVVEQATRTRIGPPHT